ncbi:MAG TPA: hypothetical protein VMU87_19495 [Stellaceae bacterium]|nr:hypothetical protein [Stellaceae bacterium]
MKELIVRDDRELRRLDAAITAIRRTPVAAQTSRRCLLAALEAERNELLRSHGRSRPS